MKTIQAEKTEVITFKFECPHCKVLWIMSNDTDYDEDEQDILDNLINFNETSLKCDCENIFWVKAP